MPQALDMDVIRVIDRRCIIVRGRSWNNYIMLRNYIFKQISWNGISVKRSFSNRAQISTASSQPVFILNFVRSILVAFDTV